MDIAYLIQHMDGFIQFLIDWGYGGMFLSAFLAGTVLPFSSEVVLLACVALGLAPVWSTPATTSGHVLGGLTCYWIGRVGTVEWIERYFRVDKKQLDKAARFIHGKGSWMALFSFLPVIGDALLIALGLMKANVWIVTLAMGIGKLARYAIIVMTALGTIQLIN